MSLKTLILTKPGYVDATDPTDQAVLDWLNANQSVWIDVPWLEYAIWLSGNNGTARMQREISNLSDDIAGAAQLGLAILNAGKDLSLSRTEVRTDMGKLVPSVFTIPEKDLLLAKAQIQVQRFKNPVVTHKGISLSRVSLTIVSEARNG